MSDTLRVFNGFFPYDYKALEQTIEMRARDGWKLTGVGRLFLRYTRETMTGKSAHVEIFTGAYEEDNEKKLAAYKKRRCDDGWEFIGDLDFFYFWYIPEGQKGCDATPEAERQLMQRMVWSRELSAFGIMLAMVILGIVALFKLSYTDFLTFTGVGSILMAPLFSIPSVIVAAYLFRDVKRQSAYLKRGECLPQPDLSAAVKRCRAMYTLLLCAAVYILAIFLLDAVFGYTRYLMLIIPLTVASAAVLLIQKLPKTKGRQVLLVAVLVLCGVGMFMLQRWQPVTKSAPEDMSYVLTLEDAAGVAGEKLSYRETVSPFVPAHFIYTESDNASAAKNEYFRIPNALIRRWVLYEITKTIGSRATLEEGDAALWDADRVRIASDGGVLVERGTEIFYYSATDPDKQPIPLTPFYN